MYTTNQDKINKILELSDKNEPTKEDLIEAQALWRDLRSIPLSISKYTIEHLKHLEEQVCSPLKNKVV